MGGLPTCFFNPAYGGCHMDGGAEEVVVSCLQKARPRSSQGTNNLH
jgi:hypothetical protein